MKDLKPFIEELSKIIQNSRQDLIEGDLILCNILAGVASNSECLDNFLLKGGTCLIKSYLDYYRFSEDLDVTFRKQDIINDLSKREKKEYKNQLLRDFSELLETISKNNGFDFKNIKSDTKYYMFRTDQFVDLKLYYKSSILGTLRSIKIQFSIMEQIIFPPEQRLIKNLVPISKELEFLFPEEYSFYRKDILIPSYNIKEILCEKIRAILTRYEVKQRDIIDIYYILDKYHFNLKDFVNPIIEKTNFTCANFKEFREILASKIKLIEEGTLFNNLEAEQNILIKEIDRERYKEFRYQLTNFLKEIVTSKELITNVES